MTALDAIAWLWPALLTVVGVGLSALATAHVLLHKEEARAAVGWVALVWLVPLVGAALTCRAAACR